MSPASPLATDDAQLISKLQDVRDHLTQELQHLTAQVERKTLQLRGIESILEDARGGSTNGKAAAPEAPATPVLEVSANAPVVAAPATSPDPQPEPEAPAPEFEATEAVPEPEAIVPSAPVAEKLHRAKTPAAERTPPTAKSTAKSTKSKPPAAKSKQSTPKLEPSAKPTELRQALQPQFQGKTLAESIREVLATASEPLTAKDVVTELYEGLTIDDLKRATKTVATILGAGRTKGDWKSPGKGLYQAGGMEGQSILGAAALSGVV
ncbi:MAG TPA: hypothetical protein V6D18_19545 [Thermosynechococcaceae cyanobacterium]